MPLPPELIDAVVDYLRDDYSSLSACSLVSTAFVDPAQRRIFRSLWLHATGSLRHLTFHAAAASLAQFSHLRSYIRDLTIIIGASVVESEHSALESVLCAVKNVERLMISSRSPMFWNKLSHGLESALHAVVSLPSLRELYLSRIIGIPSDFIIRAASSVSFLSVHQIALNKGTETQFGVQDAPNVQLAHLEIRHFWEHANHFCNLFLKAPVSISRMERLTIHMDSRSRKYDSHLLLAVAPSLRTLSINTGGLHDTVDFPHMPLVSTFEIIVYVDEGRCLPAKFHSTFTKIAVAFPGIEVLKLTFRFDPAHPEIPWRPEGTLPILGASFSTRTQLVHLRQVHCRLVPRGGRPDKDAAIRHLREAMSQLMPGVPTDMVTFRLGEYQPLFLESLPFVYNVGQF